MTDEVERYAVEHISVTEQLRQKKEEIKGLKKRKDELELAICEFLQCSETSAVEVRDYYFRLEKKKKRNRKPPKQKEDDIVAVLRRAGLESPERVYSDLLSAQRGEMIESLSLKCRHLKGPAAAV